MARVKVSKAVAESMNRRRLMNRPRPRIKFARRTIPTIPIPLKKPRFNAEESQSESEESKQEEEVEEVEEQIEEGYSSSNPIQNSQGNQKMEQEEEEEEGDDDDDEDRSSSTGNNITIIIQHSKRRVFKDKAEEVKQALEEALPGITVTLNPRKFRRLSCFDIEEEGGEKFYSFRGGSLVYRVDFLILFQRLKYPFKGFEELDVQSLVSNISDMISSNHS